MNFSSRKEKVSFIDCINNAVYSMHPIIEHNRVVYIFMLIFHIDTIKIK